MSLIYKDGVVSMDNMNCSLKSVIITAVVVSFVGNTFRFFQKNKALKFHVNCLPADDSHEILSLIRFLTFEIFISSKFFASSLKIEPQLNIVFT